MLEIAVYEGRKRLRGALALTAGLSLLALLYVWMFPSISAGIDLDEYVEALPPSLVEAFGLRALSTIEGFLAAELYAFGWVILLGIYFAYAAASLVAPDVERRRMDLLLALPRSRRRIVSEKAASLLVPLVLLNAVVAVVIYASVGLIDESLSLVDLLAVHALSIPYLLACAGVGLVASVVADRASVAQRVAMGVVFGLFLVESAVAGTDVEFLGALSPSRYYDPTAILVDGAYDLPGAAVLLGAAAVLLLSSLGWFSRKDID